MSNVTRMGEGTPCDTVGSQSQEGDRTETHTCVSPGGLWDPPRRLAGEEAELGSGPCGTIGYQGSVPAG